MILDGFFVERAGRAHVVERRRLEFDVPPDLIAGEQAEQPVLAQRRRALRRRVQRGQARP